MRRAALLLVLTAACSTQPKAAPPPPPAAAATTPSAAPIVAAPDAAPAAFALPGIPPPRAPGKGPLKVEGDYPAPLDVGMSDAAQAFGFMSDGKTFAYCLFDQCCREGISWCELYDDKGGHTQLQSPHLFEDQDPKRPGARRTEKELKELPKKEGLISLPPPKDMATKAPPPKGDLLYGDEITVVVREIPATTKPDGTIKIPSSVRIGGKLAGEAPVFVGFPPAPDFCKTNPEVCYEARVNGLAVSPSGEDLGVVVYIRLPSHGSHFTQLRVTAAAFAASVFNDTGMAHHKKKEWARATELFTRAVYADPSKQLFAFNLACALAQQKDPRAEHALRHAITLGGDAVKKRAAADADFALVKDEAWFVATTR